MPSTSKAQQRLMGMAYSLKKGDMDPKDASQEVKDLADSMTLQQLKDFASKITINGKPLNESSGPSSNTLGEETTVVPVSAKTKTSGRSVNCTTDIIDGSTGKVTSNSQIYSIDAMACRRVKFSATVTIPPKPVNPANQTNSDKPEPTKTIETTRCARSSKLVPRMVPS